MCRMCLARCPSVMKSARAACSTNGEDRSLIQRAATNASTKSSGKVTLAADSICQPCVCSDTYCASSLLRSEPAAWGSDVRYRWNFKIWSGEARTRKRASVADSLWLAPEGMPAIVVAPSGPARRTTALGAAMKMTPTTTTVKSSFLHGVSQAVSILNLPGPCLQVGFQSPV
jgi:hypothetical protein